MKEDFVEVLAADDQDMMPSHETTDTNVNQVNGSDILPVDDVTFAALFHGDAQSISHTFLDNLVAFQTNYMPCPDDYTSSTAPVTPPHYDVFQSSPHDITRDQHSSPSKQIFDLICTTDIADHTEETNLEDSGNVSDYQQESSLSSVESSEVILSSSIRQDSFDAVSPVTHPDLPSEHSLLFHPQLLSQQLYACSPIQSMSPLPIIPRPQQTTLHPSVQYPTEYVLNPNLVNILPKPELLKQESKPQIIRQSEPTRQSESIGHLETMKHPEPTRQPGPIKPESSIQGTPMRYNSIGMVPIRPAPATHQTSAEAETNDVEFVTKKKTRTSYTMKQIRTLERIFLETPYPDTEKIDTISVELEISEQKLRIWFQNKRARWRKRAKNNETAPNPVYLPPLSLSGKLRSEQSESIPPTSYSLTSRALMSLHSLSAQPNKENRVPSEALLQSSTRGVSSSISCEQSAHGIGSGTSIHPSSRGISSLSTGGISSSTPLHQSTRGIGSAASLQPSAVSHNASDLLSIMPSASLGVTSSSLESANRPFQPQFSSGCCYGQNSTNSLHSGFTNTFFPVNHTAVQSSRNVMTQNNYGCYPSNFYGSSSMPMMSPLHPETDSYLSCLRPQSSSSLYYKHTQGQYNNCTSSFGFM